MALFNRVNARYIVRACNATDCVDSEELIATSSLDIAIGYFKASNNDGAGIETVQGEVFGDRFGYSISLSADGKTMAVETPGFNS